MATNTKQERIKLIQPERNPTAEGATQLLTDVIHGFIPNAQRSIKLSAAVMSRTVLISILASPDEHPKLVGKLGKQIWALKLIFEKRIAKRIGRQIEIQLRTPATRSTKMPPPFKFRAKWNEEKVCDLLRRCLAYSLTCPFSFCVVPVDDEMTGIELTVHDLELDDVRGSYIEAIRNIFNAIGRHEGRNLVLDLNDPAPPDAPPKIDDQLDVVRIEPRDVDQRKRDLDAEAHSRGLV